MAEFFEIRYVIFEQVAELFVIRSASLLFIINLSYYVVSFWFSGERGVRRRAVVVEVAEVVVVVVVVVVAVVV